MHTNITSPEDRAGLITEIFTWIDNKSRKRHISIRVMWLHPPEPIDPSLGLHPIPGSAILLYNVIKANCIKWSARNLKPPQSLEGHELHARIDCIAESDSVSLKRNLCTYFTSAKNLEVGDLVEAAKLTEREYFISRLRPAPLTRKRQRGEVEALGTRLVNHAKNVEEVGNKLLMECYPRVYSLLNGNQLRSSPLTEDQLKAKAAEALYLDLLSQGITNIAPKNLTAVINSNPDFIEKMADARDGKCPVSDLSLHLFRGWISEEYMNMTGEELSSRLEKETGQKVKPNTLTKMISRLGLERATTSGAPPKRT